MHYVLKAGLIGDLNVINMLSIQYCAKEARMEI